jgi:hypothetical protein
MSNCCKSTTPAEGGREVLRMSRRGVLLAAGAAAALRPFGASTAQAAVAPARTVGSFTATGYMPDVPQDLTAILEEWAQSPSTHPIIGDWRRAGYRRGELQPAPQKRRVLRGADLGIRPGTGQDVSGALQQAVDRLGRVGGGVLQLSAGRYVLNNPVVYPRLARGSARRGKAGDHALLRASA